MRGEKHFFCLCFFYSENPSNAPAAPQPSLPPLPPPPSRLFTRQLGGPAATSSASSSSAEAPPTRGTDAAGALSPFPPAAPVQASSSARSCLLTEALASSSDEYDDIDEKLEAEPPAPRRGRAPSGVVPGERGREEEVEGGGEESLL